MSRAFRRPSSTRRRLTSIGVTVGVISSFLFAFAPAGAQAVPSAELAVYNAIPTTLPGNVSSQAFEAQSASEFGDHVTLGVGGRHLTHVTVVMSSWGCQTGHWYSGDCSTTPESTFPVEISLKIHNAASGPAPGTLVTSKTTTFYIPYRPSADVSCTGDDAGKWKATDGNCYNGYATPIVFDFTGSLPTVPDDFIWTVAFNTTHYGSSPIGESAACYASSGGCGYDSLNVGTQTFAGAPFVGTDTEAGGAFLNSSSGDAYCDGGTDGTGSLRFDSPCWTSYKPLAKIQVRSLADVGITKTGAINPVAPGGFDPLHPGNRHSVTYTMVVTNHGPDYAQSVVLSDTLPTQLAAAAAKYCTTTGASCTPSTGDDYNGATILLGTMAPGTSVTVVLQAPVRGDLRDGPYSPTNTASANSTAVGDVPASAEPDPNVYPNSATVDSLSIYTVPDPATLEAVQPGSTSLGVQWSQSNDNDGAANGGNAITGYDIIVTPTSPAGTPFTVFASPTANNGHYSVIIQSTNDNPIVNGTTYSVSVEARNAAGDSDNSAAMTALPCATCVIKQLQGSAVTFNTASPDAACPGTIGATPTDTIVTCLALTSDQATTKAGLIASLREETSTANCGGQPCIANQQVTFALSGGGNTKFDQYTILDKTISTATLGGACTSTTAVGCHLYQVYLEIPGQSPVLIGTSIKSSWCPTKAIPLGQVGCVVQVKPLTNTTTSNGKKGVPTDNRAGDLLFEIVYYGDPTSRYH